MAEKERIIDAQVTLLYTNIGRGHPFYLDGIVHALLRMGGIRMVRRERDVFEMSGFLPRLGWKLVRRLYTHGSSTQLGGRFYNRLRSGPNGNGLTLLSRVLGWDIRRELLAQTNPVLVAHPILVSVLGGRHGLLYQHGEVVVPDSACVRGAEVVFVPLEQSVQKFLDIGYDPASVVVTGLCVEPALVKQGEDAFQSRLERLQNGTCLTGAFFSSGAEPRPHIEKLVAAAISSLREGQRVILFARAGGKFHRMLVKALAVESVETATISARDQLPAELPQAILVVSASRREEDIFTARLFPYFDYLVAPSHERSNWALGLGLPMFCPEPCIGPFAPLNRDLLINQGVARRLDSSDQARLFGKMVGELRSSRELERMARSGWGRYRIDGFSRIAEFLVSRYARQ